MARPEHLVLAVGGGAGDAGGGGAGLGVALEDLRVGGAVLDDVGLAHRVGEVGAGAVRGERREHHRAAGGDRRLGRLGALGQALPAEWVDVVMGEGALAVGAGGHLGTAVLERGVGEGEPHGEVLLRLDVGVPVVLVPRHAARLLGLLVDGLIPVEAHVGTDEVGAEAEHRRVLAQCLACLGPRDGVDGDRERAGLGDGEATVLPRLEEGVDLGLERVEVVAHRGDRGLVDQVGHHDEPVLVELLHLLVAQLLERARMVRPLEAVVPGMGLHRAQGTGVRCPP